MSYQSTLSLLSSIHYLRQEGGAEGPGQWACELTEWTGAQRHVLGDEPLEWLAVGARNTCVDPTGVTANRIMGWGPKAPAGNSCVSPKGCVW